MRAAAETQDTAGAEIYLLSLITSMCLPWELGGKAGGRPPGAGEGGPAWPGGEGGCIWCQGVKEGHFMRLLEFAKAGMPRVVRGYGWSLLICYWVATLLALPPPHWLSSGG